MSERLKLGITAADEHYLMLMSHVKELHTRRVRNTGRMSGVPTEAEYQALVICIASAISTKRKLPHDFDSIGLFQDVIAAAETFKYSVEQKHFLLFAYGVFSEAFVGAVGDSLISSAA